MVKLYLDLSESRVAKVKLFNGQKEIDQLIGHSPLPLIDEILKKNDLSFKDISEVDSFPGPGSYTGLKVGAAIANLLNSLLGNNKKTTPIYQSKEK